MGAPQALLFANGAVSFRFSSDEQEQNLHTEIGILHAAEIFLESSFKEDYTGAGGWRQAGC
jgi:hypothetical protein